MPVSHKHKLILVHIPKTGGTSIEAALDMHSRRDNIGLAPYKRQKRDFVHLYGAGMQHMTLEEIREYYRSVNFNDYSNFGGLKHLVDMIISMFSPGKEGVAGSKIYSEYYKFSVVRNPYARLVSHFSWMDGKWHKNIEPTKDEFLEFVDDMLERKLYLEDLHLIPQYKFVEVDGHLGLDKILYIEDLGRDFSELCEYLGIDAVLKRRMVSKHKDYRVYYNDEARAKVYKLYQRDFELFGYPEEL